MKQIAYYSHDVDFDDLAQRDPEFAAIAQDGKRSGFINFQDPQIVQQLTKSLLKSDFDLKIELPDDRLCPPAPNRWNYVRWIQELLDTTTEEYTECYDPEREVIGVDVGVGASCIYGLLACSTREEWRMLGTEMDEHSLEFAQRNIELNGLEDRIRLKKVKGEDDILLALDAKGGPEKVDFVMTNPPFYATHEEFLESYNKGGASSSSDNNNNNNNTTIDHTPCSILTGSTNEMLHPDGSVGFVQRILTSSLRHRTRVQWYTALLHNLPSLHQIIALLKRHHITNFAVTSLQPGKGTKRWAVGWSFDDLRPRNDVARHGDLVLGVLPLATEWTVKVAGTRKKAVGEKVQEVMKDLDGEWEWRALHDAGIFECGGNVWSRAARRKKRFGDEGKEHKKEEKAVALAVKLTARDEELEVRWLRGTDHTLFESICGMLKRSMNAHGGGG